MLRLRCRIKIKHKGEIPMSIVNDTSFSFNKQFKFNFNGGELSSDGGLFLLKEFAHRIGFEKIIRDNFQTNDSAAFRFHTDDKNLMQRIFQLLAGYFNDNDADELTTDPVFCAVLGKDALASQPTMSRFFNRLDEDSLVQFEKIFRILRQKVYGIRPPENILLDLDSTLLQTYGHQEGEGFNYHYQSHGYHPLLCFDGLTGDLLKAELRKGTKYCSSDAHLFLESLLNEFLEKYPDTMISLRGDSGFAAPEIYDLAETHACSYAIRLKMNSTLRSLASDVEADLDDLTKDNKVDYAVCYGEFMYKAGSWNYARRVVCKVEKPTDQMTYMYTFIVTNMDLAPEDIIRFYCNRGRMENFIKESKNGFDFSCMSSHSMVVNAGRLMICMLAYNLFNWFKRLVLPKHFQKMQIETFRLKLIKIAVRMIRSSRYRSFRFCSSCPYKAEFREILLNIQQLQIPELAA